ncbi:sigma-70 family RNA polymerase sigma factor [Elioraea sp. Yellowstone]|jgi:RNA polymerase sigma-70 factor (ECF subfamily)|uniref:sigma-70 family RNA polymerase sigma factor n=1 Tax=Elioraea sp. Yellowstone TaxID=2592070 RepID=UPI0011521C70|nr:sigma-70 family RNA polymerase sigma factor [Elioraea sp. Yellowstone]TQF82232.1 sigma-70 family RNA polymerase sigma factor [Elioraea sp. Yellowstone]
MSPADPGEAAFRAELIALLPQLRAFARFLARDRAEAEDLVQETTLRALAAWGQYQPGTNLRAWLFAIQRNLFRQGLRRRRPQGEPAEERGAPPGQDAHMAMGELARALRRLPPAQREAILLVGAQGFSYEEAAAICATAVGTMKARVSRARSALARALGRPDTFTNM